MKRKRFILGGLLFAILILASGLSFAGEKRYEVTITNLTRGQIFSPPIAISHNYDFNLFTLGEPASDELYPLAEDGDRGPLINHIDTLPSANYVLSDGPVLPGESKTLTIIQRSTKLISVAGMLVSTNDAFFAARNLKVPRWGEVTRLAVAYDAGTEKNTELCAFIPGPPCIDGAGVRDPEVHEKNYVHVHAGVHGIGALEPAEADWRNPVAKVTVRRVYHR